MENVLDNPDIPDSIVQALSLTGALKFALQNTTTSKTVLPVFRKNLRRLYEIADAKRGTAYDKIFANIENHGLELVWPIVQDMPSEIFTGVIRNVAMQSSTALGVTVYFDRNDAVNDMRRVTTGMETVHHILTELGNAQKLPYLNTLSLQLCTTHVPKDVASELIKLLELKVQNKVIFKTLDVYMHVGVNRSDMCKMLTKLLRTILQKIHTLDNLIISDLDDKNEEVAFFVDPVSSHKYRNAPWIRNDATHEPLSEVTVCVANNLQLLACNAACKMKFTGCTKSNLKELVVSGDTTFDGVLSHVTILTSAHVDQKTCDAMPNVHTLRFVCQYQRERLPHISDLRTLHLPYLNTIHLLGNPLQHASIVTLPTGVENVLTDVPLRIYENHAWLKSVSRFEARSTYVWDKSTIDDTVLKNYIEFLPRLMPKLQHLVFYCYNHDMKLLVNTFPGGAVYMIDPFSTTPMYTFTWELNVSTLQQDSMCTALLFMENEGPFHSLYCMESEHNTVKIISINGRQQAPFSRTIPGNPRTVTSELPLIISSTDAWLKSVVRLELRSPLAWKESRIDTKDSLTKLLNIAPNLEHIVIHFRHFTPEWLVELFRGGEVCIIHHETEPTCVFKWRRQKNA